MRTGIDPKVDYAFKKLFGSEANRPLLIDLLNAALELPEGKRVREVTLLNPFTETSYTGAKVAILDVKARDESARHHHLEMQRVVPWSFDKRVLFYWATLHSQQMLAGDYYETLRTTYSICIVNEAFLAGQKYDHVFRPMDAEHGVTFSKDLEVRVLELSKFSLTAEQVRTPLERWCYFLKHGESLDSEQLPASLDTPVIRQALEALMTLSQDELERFRYLDRLMAHRDEVSRYRAYEDGTMRARKEGLEKGIEEGIEKGELIGRIYLCQRALKQPLASREELLRLSPADLAHKADELERQLLPGDNGAG